MSTLSQIIKQKSVASHADIEWLNVLTNEWQLVADLVFADLVLWLPGKDGSFVAAGHARPSSAATIFYRDISGESVRAVWAEQVSEAFTTGDIMDQVQMGSFDGIPNRFTAYPVRRRANIANEAVKPEPIAVITRHTNLADSKVPN